ncbi:RNA exonuclease 1 like protein [Melipona quadrifasciata]|uniref:RNA exonuclease 1 like protein n=1 Tax=Melipona quadrifasciata TaxID=166423 RepID=A0A0N1IU33_9HYME|nr:RNA exonuclease 1 like protein [Melipona quadrifasciata]
MPLQFKVVYSTRIKFDTRVNNLLNLNATESEKVKFDYSKDSASGSAATTSSGSNKRAKNKKRREAQQEFTHSWLRGALKGHTASVLNMNFSSNGKYLASCAEGDPLTMKDIREVTSTSFTDSLYPCHEPDETTRHKPINSMYEISDSLTDSESISMLTTTSHASSNGAIIAAQSSPSSSSSSSSQSTKEDRATLSRRQRKNRTKYPREQQQCEKQEQQQQQHQHQHCQDPKTYQGAPIWMFIPQVQTNYHQLQTNFYYQEYNYNAISGPRGIEGFVSAIRQQLWLNDADLAMILRRYTLPWDELIRYGYPMECSNYPGSVMIVNHFPLKRIRRCHLDANAQEFVPGGKNVTIESEADSGNSSGSSDFEQESSSDSDKNSDNGESTYSSSSDFACQEASRRNSAAELHENVHMVERNCARCKKLFYVNHDGSNVPNDCCSYHWGKLHTELVNYTEIRVWGCCHNEYGKPGCTTAKTHVWTGLTQGVNGPFDGYVRTQVSRFVPEDGNYGVFALDCEMCFSQYGLELSKVTVVDMNGIVVYDTLVKPEVEVIDYSTKYSGITEHDLANVSKTLRDVQNDLISFIHAETILIGHGLENDLRALKLIHTTVIDTSALYPHYLGFPYRCSLKSLARGVLRREIQIREHDSMEDARAALDLVLKKIADYISPNDLSRSSDITILPISKKACNLRKNTSSGKTFYSSATPRRTNYTVAINSVDQSEVVELYNSIDSR